MKKQVFILSFLVFLCLNVDYSSLAQAPVNDFCVDAIDISDGLWEPGTNQNATLHCGADFRNGNCAATQQWGVNKCCYSGQEGTIWYKFTCTSSGTASIEFRNTVCNPTSYLGVITTTLQGFVLKKPTCAFPESDSVLVCFDPATAANFSVSFTVVAGQIYYVQIDTKKNSSASCSDCNNTATCHSYCSFETRLLVPTPTPISGFKAKAKKDFVSIKWLYDWKDNYTHFLLSRKNIFTGDSAIVAYNEINSFGRDGIYFAHNDYAVDENGYYSYNLYGTIGNTELELVGSEVVQIDFAKELRMQLVPNPASDNVKLLLYNTLNGNYFYSLYNLYGQEVLNGITEAAPNSETVLNIETLSKGMYVLKISLEDRILQQFLIVE